ncbi:class I SAM-dependent methyltransferase [Alteromonas gracilis]
MTGPARYAHLDFNAPLSDARAEALVSRLVRRSPGTVLDIGCGWAELLLRVLAAAPTATGLGLDTDGELIARGTEAAGVRDLADRVLLVERGVRDDEEPADLVLCVGSSHALADDPADALARLTTLVRPGGTLLLGEGVWHDSPGLVPAVVPADMTTLPDLAELVALAEAAGLRPLWIEEADAGEWDAFESGFLADAEEWLIDHAEDPEADVVRERARAHREMWLSGYRGRLGFAYLTLVRPRS